MTPSRRREQIVFPHADAGRGPPDGDQLDRLASPVRRCTPGPRTSPEHVGRPVPVPSLAASDPDDDVDGGYWLGGSWPCTTYMVLRGLTDVGRPDVAGRLARDVVEAVRDVLAETGTLWENLAPELPHRPGDPAEPNFCGWAGLFAVAIPREFL